MARKVQRIEVFEMDDIYRGTSIKIPVILKKDNDTILDVAGYELTFTLKACQSDFDYDDDRALITKVFQPNPKKLGRFDITLTSKETWLEPGEYYFDLMLSRNKGASRLMIGKFLLVGGPTNKLTNHDQDQEYLDIYDALEITPSSHGYIVVSVPLVTDPPKTILETADGDPAYIYQGFGNPVNQIKYRVYGPRVSLMMTLRVPHDHTEHRYRFDQFFLNNHIPLPCPLHNGYLEFKNRRLSFHLNKVMDMMWYNTSIQHSPEITYDGNTGFQPSDQPIYVGDNVDAGNLICQFNHENDQIHFTGHHYVHDDHGEFMYWMIRIDWFNWVDPYEEDPERPDVSTHMVEGCPIADTWEGYWPPYIWYTNDDTEYAKQKSARTTCPGAD